MEINGRTIDARLLKEKNDVKILMALTMAINHFYRKFGDRLKDETLPEEERKEIGQELAKMWASGSASFRSLVQLELISALTENGEVFSKEPFPAADMEMRLMACLSMTCDQAERATLKFMERAKKFTEGQVDYVVVDEQDLDADGFPKTVGNA